MEQQLRHDLAALYRLMHHFRWEELIYTHASVRVNDQGDFLLNDFRYRFDEITASNLVKLNINDTRDAVINRAGFMIHSSIYRARPDVNCIIHTHTREGTAVSACPQGLLPISQAASLLISAVAYHDYHGVVEDAAVGQALVNDLGADKYCLIMRNHGLLTIGPSVAATFHRMFRLQSACEIQVLCDPNNVVLVKDDILERQKQDQDRRNHIRPGTDLAWESMVRLVKKLYPDYES